MLDIFINDVEGWRSGRLNGLHAGRYANTEDRNNCPRKGEWAGERQTRKKPQQHGRAAAVMH